MRCESNERISLSFCISIAFKRILPKCCLTKLTLKTIIEPNTCTTLNNKPIFFGVCDVRLFLSPCSSLFDGTFFNVRVEREKEIMKVDGWGKAKKARSWTQKIAWPHAVCIIYARLWLSVHRLRNIHGSSKLSNQRTKKKKEFAILMSRIFDRNLCVRGAHCAHVTSN